MDDDLKVERGIPIPRRAMGRAPEATPYTVVIRRLDVDESVLLPVGLKSAHNAIHFATAVQGYTKRKFTCRSVTGGTRVWRVK